MPATHLVALLEARPVRPFWGRPWLEALIEDHVPPIAPGDGPRTLGWSVGAVFGAETLVQSRPIVRGKDVDLVDDLLRAKAACTVAAMSVGADDTAAPRDVVRIGRFRRWIGAAAGPSLPERLRREMYSELPDFLARSNGGGKTDAELMLMRVLAALHRAGSFGKPLPPAEAIRSGLAELAQMLPEDETRAVFVSDGRTLGLLHRGGTLLSHAPPDALRPAARFRVAVDVAAHGADGHAVRWSRADRGWDSLGPGGTPGRAGPGLTRATRGRRAWYVPRSGCA